MLLEQNRLNAYLPKQSGQRLLRALTVINAYGATPHRATPHPGNAHWCEWAPDYGFGRRNKTVNTGD
jgi:hypothetical protein